MKQRAPLPFEDSVNTIENSMVLLDVDGTLHADGARSVSENIRAAVATLAQKNDVYLVSNGTDGEWVDSLARELNLRVAPVGVPAGKPSVRVIEGIEQTGKDIVVIGDKYLTDGLLARNLGARFVLTERVRSGEERLSVKIAYLLDRVVSWFL